MTFFAENREGHTDDFLCGVLSICRNDLNQRLLLKKTLQEIPDILQVHSCGLILFSATCSRNFTKSRNIIFVSDKGHTQVHSPLKTVLWLSQLRLKMILLSLKCRTNVFCCGTKIITVTVSYVLSGSDKETCLYTGSSQNWYNLSPMVSHRRQKLRVGQLFFFSQRLLEKIYISNFGLHLC